MNCTTLSAWKGEKIEVAFHSYKYTNLKPYLKHYEGKSKLVVMG